MRMQVRCCCQPTKLLGTVEVPDMTLRSDHVSFGLVGHLGDNHVETLTLPLARIANEWTEWTAVKAEGVDIETLRRIPSFIEAAHDD